MTGAPWPGAFECDHLTLPRVRLEGRRVEVLSEPSVAPAKLSRRDRSVLATQLLAAVVALEELGAWPGLAAIRGARVVETDTGLTMRLAGVPRPLAVVERRHGRSVARAGERWRRVRAAVVERLGPVGASEVGREPVGEAPSLELVRMVEGLRRPLPAPLVESLLAVRWPSVPLPQAAWCRAGRWRMTVRRLAWRPLCGLG